MLPPFFVIFLDLWKDVVPDEVLPKVLLKRMLVQIG